MHFFYESISITQWLIWIAVWVCILAANEFSRQSLKTGIFTFVILPAFLFIFVWPNTSEGTNVDNWFQHAKIVSALIGTWIFMALRFSDRVRSWNWFKILPAVILAINMWEAIDREFEISHMTTTTVVDGMTYMGGTWNTINAVSGIINLLLICGWVGIFISKDKQRTMIWPDQLWLWILGYDLWNWAYCYNALGDRSFYVFPILFSAAFADMFIRKGGWLQHRAHTLALNNIFIFTFPAFFVSSQIAVQSSWNPAAMWFFSIISIVFNVGLAIYQVRRMIINRKNPITQEIYTDHKAYKEIMEEEAKYAAKNNA